MRERTKKILLGISFAIITAFFLHYLGVRPLAIIQDFNNYKNHKNEIAEDYEKNYHGSAFERYADAVNYGLQYEPIDLDTIPEYSGEQYYIVNNNNPGFTKEELEIDEPFELYSPQDDLGRCGANIALVSKETAPAESKRSINISSITPSGWSIYNTKTLWNMTLPDDTFYLYNRCHLLAYSVAAQGGLESDENFDRSDLSEYFKQCNSPFNLITGTRQFNLAMNEYEKKVASYIKKDNHSVLYRVTPLFKDNELIARGVLMEAIDRQTGFDIRFCVFIYNVQDGFTIDYSTGEASFNG